MRSEEPVFMFTPNYTTGQNAGQASFTPFPLAHAPQKPDVAQPLLGVGCL